MSVAVIVVVTYYAVHDCTSLGLYQLVSVGVPSGARRTVCAMLTLEPLTSSSVLCFL